MRKIAILGFLLLSACGVPSDPEAGPVVLRCDGELQTSGPGDVPEKKRIYYRVDGTEGTAKRWNDEQQIWMGNLGRLSITPATIHHSISGEIGDRTTVRTIDFDRRTGDVTEEFASDYGTVTFQGTCAPVLDPQSDEKKF
jgi:hypothetical protein